MIHEKSVKYCRNITEGTNAIQKIRKYSSDNNVDLKQKENSYKIYQERKKKWNQKRWKSWKNINKGMLMKSNNENNDNNFTEGRKTEKQMGT